jgi:site-specific DNA-methyltransferase (adenine-specific)
MEKNTIQNEDCLTGLKFLQDASVDMVFADLPYGVTRNAWDSEIDLDLLFPELWRVLKPTGVIVMTAQQPFTSTLVTHQRQHFRYELIWNKVLVSGFLNANRQPLRCHESVLVFSRQQGTYNPQKWLGDAPAHSKKARGMANHNYGKFDTVDNGKKHGSSKFPRSIITFQKPHPSVAVHPTQKPIELLEWIIRTFTNNGALVLDPCMGSGSTAIACRTAGRDFIGFERDSEYHKICLQRIEQLTLEVLE